MAEGTVYVCAVCGNPIPSDHGRFVLPSGHHVHPGCKDRIRSAAQTSGQRTNSMFSYSPESAALQYQWRGGYRPAELYVQRNEVCPPSPGRAEAAEYYKTGHDPLPCCDKEPSADRILRAQAEAWTGWAAYRQAKLVGRADPDNDGRRIEWQRGPYGLAHHPRFGTVVESRRIRVGAVTLAEDEKFLDPRLACGGSEYFNPDPVDAAGNLNERASIGYLLKTPNNAKARIAAIRKKVNDFKAADRKPGKGVKMISDLSIEALENLSKDLYLKYQEVLRDSTDPKQVEEFAKKMGKSVPQVLQEAPDVIQSYTGFDVKQLGDIGKEVWAAIGPLIIKELKELAKTFEETAKAATDAASGLADAASAVPLFGAMVSMGVKMFVAANKEADERYQTLCNDFITGSITVPMKKTMNRGLPIPWHALEWDLGCRTREGMLDVKKWTPTPDQEATARSFQKNLDRWESIHDIALLAEAGHWWTLATQLMGVKEIEPIFAALGNNSDGAGLLASDEQVMLVAAPIAISFGLPIDEFAERLWNKSAGWRSGGPLLKPEPVIHYGYDDEDIPIVLSKECEKEAANALQVQWGVLARDAFSLADQMKKEKDAQARVEEGLKTANVPSILGGLATGALALAGAPVALAAIPVLIGYWLSRRAKAAAQEQAPAAPVPPKYKDIVITPTAAPPGRLGLEMATRTKL